MGGKVGVVIGPECSGKTTLVESVHREFGLPFSEEYAREYVLNLGRELVFPDVELIVKGQLENEQRLKADNPDADLVLMDTNLLSSLIYSEWYFGQVPKGLRELIEKQRYDRYFLCRPEFDWVPDPSRGPNTSESMFSFFRQKLEGLNVPYLMIEGDSKQRAELLIKEVRRLTSITSTD